MSPLRRYGVALASFALAYAVTRALWPIKEEGVFVLFVAAVMLSAWYGGPVPGALTAVLSALAANFTFLPPIYSLAVVDLSTTLRITEFLVVSALVIGLNAARSRAQERAEAARAEAEAANRAKDDFLAMVSHDLRAPLSAILGWTQIMDASGHEPQTCARGLVVIKRNAAAQRQLIDDLMDVARVTSGTLRLERRAVRLRDVVAAAVESVRPSAEAKGIRLEAALGAEGARVSGDAGRLEQIVMNLLSNAVKFTPEGGRVSVTLDASSAEARLVVGDTGCGIEAEFLPHVFERFRQSDGAGNLRRAGLGLGLAIVRHLVELHDGTVKAESDGPDRGATFTVRLPLASPAKAGAVKEERVCSTSSATY
ncbi:MAG TPA: HAMP domain-containing sensor histidine kinase [Pyrinomonadaceae bacterium]|nr:HAMP domain-containing sensor histidine kinase [Pyrinomonadaceae bacterium]